MLLTSFCVHVFGQYLSSPLMICRENIKLINKNNHCSKEPSRVAGWHASSCATSINSQSHSGYCNNTCIITAIL